jgi:hypothetical protein
MKFAANHARLKKQQSNRWQDPDAEHPGLFPYPVKTI